MKRKVWDITVKDNPNRVVMGENDDFYTTDTEAFLVFNLQDKDFNPQSAMLTLENRNDGSLKSEEVSVVGDNITWEMPERYIEHSGNWQAQLVYEQMKGDVPEKYTSGVMAFTVNSHIKDKKRPSLVEIETWEKFIAEGTELIETWEDLDALREENERQRELAESARENEFETNETARQSTFETNETERQNEFESNEDERESTFETNESIRQANEQGRESAESVRVANEEERISKDSERDSKIEAVESNLESKVNKKQEDWITPTLLNGATGTIKYMKNELGKIEFKGVCTSIHGVPAFRLPFGYRINVTTVIHLPITATPFPLREIQFLANGEVYFVMPYGSSEVNFNGVSISLD